MEGHAKEEKETLRAPDEGSLEAAREIGLQGKKGQPGPPPPPDVRIGGRWMLDRKIGSGAFGDIYIGKYALS